VHERVVRVSVRLGFVHDSCITREHPKLQVCLMPKFLRLMVQTEEAIGIRNEYDPSSPQNMMKQSLAYPNDLCQLSMYIYQR